MPGPIRETRRPKRLTDIIHAAFRGHVLRHASEHVHCFVRREQRASEVRVVAYEQSGIDFAVEQVLPRVFE